jgi:hypothetical protein
MSGQYSVAMAVVGRSGIVRHAIYHVAAADRDGAIRSAWDMAEADYARMEVVVPYPVSVDGVALDAEVDWAAIREAA